MTEMTEQNRVFKLDNPYSDPLRNKIFSLMEWPVERLLLFHHLNQAYTDVARMRDPRPFLEKALDRLNVRYSLPEEDFIRLNIPRGAVVVVANHPFGGIEGMILASLLRSIRCDVKIMANYLLTRIPEMRELLITVDPFGSPRSSLSNIAPLRQCVRWVKGGGMLVVFPAGEVSHLDPLRGPVDPTWNENIARIVRMTTAPVLPVYFSGTNSLVFHAAGMVHPLLRTARLPAELLNKGRKTIQMAVGRLIEQERLASFGSDRDMTEHLRMRTYLLAHRSNDVAAGPLVREQGSACGQTAPFRRPDILSGEITALGSDRRLAENGDLAVYLASAGEVPNTLQEIGRLREVTFREAGEGTGKKIDLDRFDEHYLHLFLWNRATREVTGAYRIGRADEIIARYGIGGLYTSTLFSYQPAFFDRLGPALELGRSFVRTEYQKSYAPLLLLWKGIGQFIVRSPRYTTLFGPVSISNDYAPLSRQLMAGFLIARCSRTDLSDLVKPTNRYRIRTDGRLDQTALQAALADEDRVSELVGDIERDGKGMPILLRQYLKLGGSVVGFNVDPDFGNVLDGLIVVDLLRTDRKVLDRYLGKDNAVTFLERHRAKDRGAA
jgi:putative hemolysin